MSARLGKQKSCSGFGSACDFVEEALRVGKFVNYGEGECEVNFSRHIIEAHRVSRADARVKAIRDAGICGAVLQAVNHLWLQIDGDHPAGGTDQARQRDREESHARAGLEDGRAFANVRFQDFRWIALYPTTNRADKKISQPPRADTV